MRDTIPHTSHHAQAAMASRPTVEVPGRRSGEGSASVLQHLAHDRACHPDKSAAQNERGA